MGVTLGDQAMPQLASLGRQAMAQASSNANVAAQPTGSAGPKPAWMIGVPTPITRALAGAENQRPGAGKADVEAARMADLVATVAQLADSTDSSRLFAPLAALRKELSTQTAPPIQQVLDLGGLPTLLALINNQSSAIQLEAAWAITNIAGGSSEHATAVIEAGGLPVVFTALESPAVPERADLCSQLLWVLGNMAADDDVRLRDRLLEAEVVGHIGKLFAQVPGFAWDTHGRTQVLRTLTWLMSCLCAGRPAPDLAEVDCAFDYFAQVVTGTDDVEMLSEALWGLHHLLDGAASEEDSDARVARALAAGFGPGEAAPPNVPHPVIDRVVASLGQASGKRSQTAVPAVKILGALVSTSKPEFTDIVIATGAVKALRRVLADTNSTAQIREQAAWVLANIAAGSPAQVQKLLDDQGAFNALKAGLERGPTKEVRSECAWAVANMTRQGAAVLSRMDSRELLRLLTVALAAATDAALQAALLDAAEAILGQAASKGLKAENPLVEVAEGYGFLDTLEELQRSETDCIYHKAAHMLETIFGVDNENQTPITPSAGQRPAANKSPATTPCGILGGSPVRPGYMFGA